MLQPIARYPEEGFVEESMRKYKDVPAALANYPLPCLGCFWYGKGPLIPEIVFQCPLSRRERVRVRAIRKRGLEGPLQKLLRSVVWEAKKQVKAGVNWVVKKGACAPRFGIARVNGQDQPRFFQSPTLMLCNLTNPLR
jgi:hypothetical protein